MAGHEPARAIVQATLDLTFGLELPTLAEGVKDAPRASPGRVQVMSCRKA